ncbi:alpha/beta hydrolase fold domain-containing protein [Stagnihabitans tardus]|uniref:Alpha/beta hydrolase fold domain-containing protein n=1 Tax=Stagnihabitans tardus TaxID=2699202 RepID=A0AAE5BTX1_9RHOB|nr:alpha/beta hydrolase [Stagnihabitans tardus]NBZ87156.1 alpha/beta hydrolase fold domain-containing protein [Stagnihabitans tardus]
MDYAKLIDAETWAFIRATDAAYPPDAVDLDIAGQRRVYDAMCAVFHRDYPQRPLDHVIAGVRVRDFAGAAPAVVYLHGGGFVVGGLDSHDDICAEINAATGLRVVLVDYRLSPENRHPAALDDCLAVVRSLGDVVLAGDSAGGNLCAAVAAQVAVKGQVLIYPGLGGDHDKGSYLSHANAPMLTRADVLFYAGIRHGGEVPAPDPSVSPLLGPFEGLPPTVAFGAECDPLCDDAEAYAAAVRAAGGRAVSFTEKGLVHGYLRARHSVTRARDSFERIKAAIAALAEGHWPYGG